MYLQKFRHILSVTLEASGFIEGTSMFRGLELSTILPHWPWCPQLANIYILQKTPHTMFLPSNLIIDSYGSFPFFPDYFPG